MPQNVSFNDGRIKFEDKNAWNQASVDVIYICLITMRGIQLDKFLSNIDGYIDVQMLKLIAIYYLM